MPNPLNGLIQMAPTSGLNDPNDAVPVPTENPHDNEFTLRLRGLVKRCGGPGAVANRSSIPLKTLANYLAGREMRRPELISLAAACNVSLEWLATGAETRPAEPSQPADPAAPLELWDQVDIDRMATALRITTDFLDRQNIDASWIHRTRMMINSYDLLGKPDLPGENNPPPEDEQVVE